MRDPQRPSTTSSASITLSLCTSRDITGRQRELAQLELWTAAGSVPPSPYSDSTQVCRPLRNLSQADDGLEPGLAQILCKQRKNKNRFLFGNLWICNAWDLRRDVTYPKTGLFGQPPQLFTRPTSKGGESARALLSSLSCDELSQRAAIILVSTDEGGGGVL